MKIDRIWAMPSRWTFSIKPIASLLQEEGALGLMRQGIWYDPFAGKYSPADYTTDKDPEANAQSHEDALIWLKEQPTGGADGILYDPPYSFRQAMKYGEKGFSKQDYWKKCKDEIARICKLGGKVISFGWNSNGIGKGRGFEITHILLVAHGGSKNDTICTVEHKI